MDDRQVLKAVLSCIEPIKLENRTLLDEKIKLLKQSDGESWAIGETIQRIIYLKGNLNESETKELDNLLIEYYTRG